MCLTAYVAADKYFGFLFSRLRCFFLKRVGLLTAVHRDYFNVINHRDLLLNDIGDRVAQLLHVELVNPFCQNRSTNVGQEILIVNTHLLFPHDSRLCLVRLHQVCCIQYQWRICLFFFFLLTGL